MAQPLSKSWGDTGPESLCLVQTPALLISFPQLQGSLLGFPGSPVYLSLWLWGLSGAKLHVFSTPLSDFKAYYELLSVTPSGHGSCFPIFPVMSRDGSAPSVEKERNRLQRFQPKAWVPPTPLLTFAFHSSLSQPC